MLASAVAGTCSLARSFTAVRQSVGSPSGSCLNGSNNLLGGTGSPFNSQSPGNFLSVQQESRLRTRLFEVNLRKKRGLKLPAPRVTANAEKIDKPDANTQNVKNGIADDIKDVNVQDAKIARRAADWKKVEKMKNTGAVHRGRVDACNSGGLLVRINSLQGFLPFSQLNGARFCKDGGKTFAEVGMELVGNVISVKVIEVVEADRRLIFSEKQAVLSESIQQIKEGTIYKGKVNSITDYGAFVDLEFPDGSYPVSGLVHVSELSWDPVPFPKDFVAIGQEVRVKVIQVDREKSKIALSVKQLQADPLLETLDTLMPTQEDASNAETSASDEELIGTSLPGLEQICEYMLQEEGISGVTLGRHALERRVVSQDLELWLSNASVEDGKFTLLARAGRQVQEVQLNTTLDRDGIKAAVQRVTGRVP